MRGITTVFLAVLIEGSVSLQAAAQGGSIEVRGSSDDGHFKLLHSITVDGGENLNDEARGIAVAEDGAVYVTGYVTVSGQGRNIWLGKYDRDLGYIDSVTVNGPANGDDEGYTIAFDESGFVYLIGYMTEPGQGHNIWLGKFSSDLVLLDDITLNGSQNDSEDGYGILFDQPSGNLYAAGYLREIDGGSNVWLGIFDTDLVVLNSITRNGPLTDDTDKARFMTWDAQRHLFVSGSMTQADTDYDIWIGKFDEDLSFIDEVIVAGPTADEDKGYGIVFDGTDTIFVTGTIIQPGQSYDIWMAAYDTDLNSLGDLTINGPADGEDVAYGMTIGQDGSLYHAGVYTELEGGSNIWVARFDENIELQSWTTIDGPASGYDTGLFVAMAPDEKLYVSAIVSDPVRGFDIWVGCYDVSTIFVDDFESGDTSAWSGVSP
ncbi:MAG: hypothetical protein V2I67_12620 [Thermoanaerobaculales bacterium]|jgi:hypothetical protein|nr:hypothetical protein [Thermoanaerobaculales bacterium]